MACLYALPQGCCILTGPWDWYQDGFGTNTVSPPETAGTPFIPRTASIYLTVAAPGPIDDHDSYDAWFVTIADSGDGVNFQDKTIQTSIAPLGVTAGELAYCYALDTVIVDDTGRGMMQVDAVSEVVDWIVTDQEWIDSYGAGTAMGAIQILPAGSGGGSFSPIPSPTSEVDDLGGDCAHSGGLLKWDITENTTLYTEWRIDTAGAKSYIEENFLTNWSAANPGADDWENPLYTAEWGYADPYDQPDNYGPLQVFLDYALPIGQAPQSEVAYGLHHPHLLDLPAWSSGYGGYWLEHLTFTARAEVHAGAIQLEGTYSYPYVSGLIWSLEIESYHPGFPSESSVIPVRVDSFDASSSNDTVATITYQHATAWQEDTIPDLPASPFIAYTALEYVSYTVLVINGTEVDGPHLVYDSAGDDFQAFYPHWINVRALHTTEAAQGTGRRFVVFARVPFDEAEALAWSTAHDDTVTAGESTVRQWMLRCYLGTALDYSFISRWGLAGQATSGIDGVEVTAPTATIHLTAIAGGDADGDVCNGALSIVVVDDPDERADYAAGVLTVQVDIAGGHDTIGDLEEIINAGGDFWATTDDDAVGGVTDGTAGSATMEGGDSSSGGAGLPTVADSSDRYFYLVNFPLRVRMTIASGVGGTRQQILSVQPLTSPASYPTSWMIAHDQSVTDEVPTGIVNPMGVGTLRYYRDGLAGGQAPGLAFSSIKNSDLLPLCPGLEEI